MNKPHLVLHWFFDTPANKLTCKIGDDTHFVEYEAIEGGCEGFNKHYRGVSTHLTIQEWELAEKFWISENWGELVGYYQPDSTRTKKHPIYGYDQVCHNGLGPDGEYLDHMQRMQIVLEGRDMATVWYHPSRGGASLFSTPDKGKTIYKRTATQDVNYPEDMRSADSYWPEWPQACLMQPRTKGYRLSNYEELAAEGAPQDIIDKCKAGEWEDAPHPELQLFYKYPTE